MENVRLGFVGVGGMGQCAHLKNFASLPDCKVVALAEPRPLLAAKVAARYGVPRIYSDAAAMLAHETLDGLVAIQPFDRHAQIVLPLYASGLPLLTEKPLASSVATGQKMLDALQKGGGWHMVGYHKRSDPASIYAKSEIDRLKSTGELGKLRYIRILMPEGDWIAGGFSDLLQTDEVPPATLPDPAPADMDAPAYEQYVRFVNYYIHQVNLMRFLLGEDYRVTHADPSGVLLAVQSESGVAGTIEMSPYRTTLDWQEEALVCFERGWVKLELPAPLAQNRPGRVTLFSDTGNAPPQTVTPQLPWAHAMRQQAATFVSAIRGEAQPPCGAAEALQDLQIARDYLQLWKGI